MLVLISTELACHAEERARVSQILRKNGARIYLLSGWSKYADEVVTDWPKNGEIPENVYLTTVSILPPLLHVVLSVFAWPFWWTQNNITAAVVVRVLRLSLPIHFVPCSLLLFVFVSVLQPPCSG